MKKKYRIKKITDPVELEKWEAMKRACPYCRNNTGFHGHTPEEINRVWDIETGWGKK